MLEGYNLIQDGDSVFLVFRTEESGSPLEFFHDILKFLELAVTAFDIDAPKGIFFIKNNDISVLVTVLEIVFGEEL